MNDKKKGFFIFFGFFSPSRGERLATGHVHLSFRPVRHSVSPHGTPLTALWGSHAHILSGMG